MTEQSKALTPVQRLKNTIAMPSVQEQFRNAMADNAPLFMASLIELFTSDKGLQECDPSAVCKEALKAASVKLPINKNLGFAWIIARKERGTPKPAMQIGWKGWVQLALRTGKYRYINAGIVWEGMEVDEDTLTGAVTITGKRGGDKPLGYFAYFQLINGFEKTIYWSLEEMVSHMKQYVPGYDRPGSAWKTSFDEMAMKTVVSDLLRKWGILSVEMMGAIDAERTEEVIAREAAENANTDTIDMDDNEVVDAEFDEPPKGDTKGGPSQPEMKF